MKRLATVIVAAMATANLALAAVERSQDAPTIDIVASNPNGSIQTRAFDISESSNHARGQLFKLDKDKGWKINAITFKKSGGQTFHNASITLYIFEGTEAQWTTGQGHPTSDANVYAGTSVKPLYSETFTLDGLILDGRFVTLRLARPLELDRGGDFGFFAIYNRNTNKNPPFFQMFESTGAQRLSLETKSHPSTDARKLLYYIEGTATENQRPLGLIIASAD